MATYIASRRDLKNNIGNRLTDVAENMADAVAVAVPQGRDAAGSRQYATMTFAQLDADSSHLAAALRDMGAQPGARLVLMVRPSIEFISLTFALFKAGIVVVLIDPGMGKEHMIKCLADVQPEGFVGIPLAQAARIFYRKHFPLAQKNVTVGRRWFWGGPTLESLRRKGDLKYQPFEASPDDPAAIIFTTGSTGPPKGVLYRHGNFSAQVDQLQQRYRIEAGEVDLPGFPLFGLFNGAMGVTTVIPDMDPTRPADVDPKNVIEAVRDWNITQAFGSPAMWNTVGRYCEEQNETLPSLRRVLSAGAPVPPHVLKRMKSAIHPEGEVFTPYGCTESLPVASISATEVLSETAEQTAKGLGTCVGTRFDDMDWKVIRIREEPIESIDKIEELPPGEIGEIIVRGPVVTTEYITRTELNPEAKIRDGNQVWHRIGDVGYFDERDRFWFCGRKAHRVQTDTCCMYTIPCEAIFNQHTAIYRSALVGIGEPGSQLPIIVAEPWPDRFPAKSDDRSRLIAELFELAQQSKLTEQIPQNHIFIQKSLPVDIRHNAKIFREKLAILYSTRV